MRSTRRRLLDVAGAIFLAALLARTVFLITGLRTYATRPEIPFRLLEMAMLLLTALFTYFFSYRFGFLPMTAASLMGLYAPIKELLTGRHFTLGYVNQKLEVSDYIFDIVLIVGLLLLAAVSVLVNPRCPRNKRNRHLIRTFSMLAMLVFAARLVYQIISLAATLIAETYPGQYTTKFFYASAATDFALILTGLACFMTAAIIPTERRRRSEDQPEK